jgi:uncharacterized membrane protein
MEDRLGWSNEEAGSMSKHRLELFTDAVVAIILTIMVLDLRTPAMGGWRGLSPLLQPVGIYMMGFLTVATLWVMNHHVFSKVQTINRRMLWSNFGHLFLLSLMPLMIRAIGEHPQNAADAVAFFVLAYLCIQCLTMFRLASRGDQKQDPEMMAWHGMRNRVVLFGTVAMAAIAGLAYVSVAASMILFALFMAFVLTTV